MSRITYKLNGVNLNELGIIVKSADGLIDLPGLKARKEYNWPDMNGRIVDTRRPYLDVRKITLDCAWPINASGMYNIQSAEQKLREDVLKMGEMVRLEVVLSGMSNKPIVFNVLQNSGLSIDRTYSGDDVLLSFKIELLEPQPCKVVLVSKAADRSGRSKVAFNTGGAIFDIDWGDGTTTYDVQGSGTQTTYHTYESETADYYVVISGDIASATFNNSSYSSDLTVLWTIK